VGRHQEFDRTDVLDQAMTVFWTKGFQGTSMVDLESATGLKPGSLYNAFGSKKGLFLDCLEHYIDRIVGERLRDFKNCTDPLPAIDAFFRTSYESLEPDQLIGCLLTNSATEIGFDDPDVRDRIASGIGRIEEAFLERLEEAKRAGDIASDADCAGLALHLVSCFQGLGVIGRLNRDKDRLGAIVDAAMTSLR